MCGFKTGRPFRGVVGDGAAEACSTQIGGGEVSASQVREIELCTFEEGAGQVRAGQICGAQIGCLKAGLP